MIFIKGHRIRVEDTIIITYFKRNSIAVCQPIYDWRSRFPLFVHADMTTFKYRSLKLETGGARRFLLLCHFCRTVPLINNLCTVTLILAQSLSTLVTGGFRFPHFNMSQFTC